MFDLVFLGTSASAPSVYRGLPAMMLLAGEYRFLIDCGEGTQRQILQSGLGYKKLNHLLLTHAHLDHILGLGGLVSTFASFEDIGEINIWGGRATLNRVERLLFGVVLDYERLNIDLKLRDLAPGRLMFNDDFSVTAFPVTHRGQGNFGFAFQARDHRPFLPEKADALGVPNGPARGQLARGESITLADGRVVSPDDVLGTQVDGAKVVVVGDASRTDDLVEPARGAHALVIESTFIHADVETARSHGHITAREAAELAAAAGVQTLILTHVSRRYFEREVVAEARSVFPESYVARDFDRFSVVRGKPVTRHPRGKPGQPEAEDIPAEPEG